MIKLLQYNKRTDNMFDVLYADNQKELGIIYMEVDGFYVYSPDPCAGGYWSGEVLKELGEHLIDMNRVWLAELGKTLREEK